ncbi:hypothetical protein [Psychroserpens sp.]|uniref:hypothetical protein n=1 Tax=Psychroserpens sp. TaxID=2020870 RepID=UPI003857F84A
MKFILSLCFLFCCTVSFSQINFEKGYLISNQGEKLDIFIKNNDWNDNPTEFKYKITLDSDQVIDESINNVKEFGIG